VELISLPRKGVLRGVFLANHLASTDNLTSNNQESEHKHKLMLTQKSGPNKQYTHKNLRQSLVS